jgi:hypothetical protein
MEKWRIAEVETSFFKEKNDLIKSLQKEKNQILLNREKA